MIAQRNRDKERPPRHGWRGLNLGLTVVFAIIVFFIFIITMLIMGLIAAISFRAGLIQTWGAPHLLRPIFGLLLFSVIIGTVVSMLMSRIPLRPVRKVIDAINQLAAGDFSARLNINRPPEFGELSTSFNHMAEELGGIELLRSDFVNNFSHEFKTPIVSIKGFAEMLKYADLTQEERDEYLDIVISESKRLATLSTNVLNLSKLETQTILSETSLFNLSEQLRRVIVLLEQQWEQKNIDLQADIEDMLLVGNDELLSQVWLNLLDNAIKFTPECGKISIRLRREDERAVFTIRDSGPGVSAEVAARLFDKFYQADSSHATPGNGLGLTVARKIVQLHQGKIICKSEPGQGCEFIVSLPRAGAEK